MLRSTDTMPRAFARIFDRGAQYLEQQIGPFAWIDEQQLARHRSTLDRDPRQRRREQHVVQFDRAAASFALFFAGRKQLLGARVGDDQTTLGVGQQNWIGDRVDDREEQRAFPAKLAHFVGEAAAAANLIELLTKYGRHPVDIGSGAV